MIRIYERTTQLYTSHIMLRYLLNAVMNSDSVKFRLSRGSDDSGRQAMFTSLPSNMADRMAGETVSTSGRLSDENLAVDRCCHLVVSTNADVARSDVQVERSMSSIAVVRL